MKKLTLSLLCFAIAGLSYAGLPGILKSSTKDYDQFVIHNYTNKQLHFVQQVKANDSGVFSPNLWDNFLNTKQNFSTTLQLQGKKDFAFRQQGVVNVIEANGVETSACLLNFSENDTAASRLTPNVEVTNLSNQFYCEFDRSNLQGNPGSEIGDAILNVHRGNLPKHDQEFMVIIHNRLQNTALKLDATAEGYIRSTPEFNQAIVAADQYGKFEVELDTTLHAETTAETLHQIGLRVVADKQTICAIDIGQYGFGGPAKVMVQSYNPNLNCSANAGKVTHQSVVTITIQ